MMRIAVIGSGIAGLSAALALRGRAHVTLFEADRRFGGHAHTVDVTRRGVTHGVDMGFLVFNHHTYPGLKRLFERLGVVTAASDMSFSVQVPGAFGPQALEWSGTNLAAVFSQRGNLARPAFWRMLGEIRRFNALGRSLARQPLDPALSLRDFLDRHGFGPAFRDWYLLPMTGCIWSSPVHAMLDFPAATLLRFCENHGLLQVADRPPWRTVAGGSREYVRRIVAGVPDLRLATPVRQVRRDAGGVLVVTDGGTEYFDRAIVATHPDQALALLAEATPDERRVLGAIRYQANRAVLHTDAGVLPQRRAAWAAWNYESGTQAGESRVCLHYLINRLQPLPWPEPVIVSLNPLRPIAAGSVVLEREFRHPVFDARAIEAQALLPRLNAAGPVHFCGAWAGYGFHEDGLRSGEAAAEDALAPLGHGAADARLAA
jgi:predicted NAD/FAD-binding protein